MNPLFNQFERFLMAENKTIYSAQMKLYIAIKKIEKSFIKSIYGKMISRILNYINNKNKTYAKNNKRI